jgi:hypothetical protein
MITKKILVIIGNVMQHDVTGTVQLRPSNAAEFRWRYTFMHDYLRKFDCQPLRRSSRRQRLHLVRACLLTSKGEDWVSRHPILAFACERLLVVILPSVGLE